MWDVAAFHLVLMGDVKYINDNSGTLKNTQFLQLGVCFLYLELKISYKLQVFIICFLQPEITDYLKDLEIIEIHVIQFQWYTNDDVTEWKEIVMLQRTKSDVFGTSSLFSSK